MFITPEIITAAATVKTRNGAAIATIKTWNGAA